MRSTLVFPPFRDDGLYNMPPLAIMRLSSVLKAVGQDVTLRDYIYKLKAREFDLGEGMYDQIARDILATEPRFVGFSVQCTTYPSALSVAKRLKQLDDSIVIGFGGHNTGFLDTVTIERYPWIDLIIRGEGEETVVDLVQTLERGGDLAAVQGITWQGPGGKAIINEGRPMIADLDALPYPDYGAVPSMAEYQQLNRMSHRTALLDAGRGCPYKCVYCSENILWNYKARMRKVPNLIEELSWLKSEHGVDKFLAAYDLFTAKRSFVIEFCESLLDAKLDMGWHCICRLDGVDDKLLQLMSRAGCDSLCYGADSGSAETLKFIKKSIREDLVFPNILATKKAKIVPTLSFVIGFPEETPAELDKTLDLALRSGMLGDNNPLLQMVTVLAGTPLLKDYEDRLVKGFETYFSAGLGFNEDGSRLDEDQAMIDADPYTFSSFYNIDPLYLELDTLHNLQRNFPLLVFLFSKSLYILNKELNPPSDDQDPRHGYLALFLEYMEYLAESGRGQWEYGIQQALEYFPEFMHHKLDGRTLRYPYVWEVLDYELSTAGLERVPKPLKEIERQVSLLEETGTLDVAVVGWSPEVTIGRFAYPLDTIFETMKATGVLPTVQPQPTTMVFSMRYYELSSQSVSPAVAEVLELAKTEPRSVAQLTELMQAAYQEVDPAQVAEGVRTVASAMLRRGVLALTVAPPVFEASREITPGLRFV